MPVGKAQLDGILSDGDDFLDTHLTFSGLQGFLTGAVTPDFRRGRMNPEKFDGEVVLATVTEDDVKDARDLLKSDFRGQGVSCVKPAITILRNKG